VLFTNALSRRLQEEKVEIAVNALHPGHVKTRMTTVDSKIYNFFTKLFNIYVSPETAARTQVYLASAPEIQGVTGKYFKNCRPIHSHKITYRRDVQELLWDLSKQWIRPHVGEIDF
jgi:NAD(P)-dependent dehydrogenase (short-subunit alcohol dehydrogenase family)